MNKGKNASTSHKMEIRNKVTNPDAATKVDEIVKRIDEWKANLRYLNEVCPKNQLTEDEDLKTILIRMLPAAERDYLTQRFNHYETFEDLETELTDYLERQQSFRKKGIHAVTSAEDAKEEKPIEMESWWSDKCGGYICFASTHPRPSDEAGPAAKRQRSDNDDRPLAPAAGCFNCGGAHYVRECPLPRQEKGDGKGKGGKGGKGKGGKGGKGKGVGKGGGKAPKGKGKGKADPTVAQWNGWNPGNFFQKSQWGKFAPWNYQQYGPQNKGVGKGAAAFAMNFPP